LFCSIKASAGVFAPGMSTSSFAVTASSAAAAPTWERARARLKLAAAEAAAGDAAAAEEEIRAALATLLSQSGQSDFMTSLAIPAQAALAALLLKNAAAARAGRNSAAATGPTPEDQEALAAYAALLGAQRAALGVHHPLVADTLGKLGNLHRSAGRHEAAHSLYSRALTLKVGLCKLNAVDP
jgi:tetratricopeptide (TPR) repeat protein